MLTPETGSLGPGLGQQVRKAVSCKDVEAVDWWGLDREKSGVTPGSPTLEGEDRRGVCRQQEKTTCSGVRGWGASTVP